MLKYLILGLFCCVFRINLLAQADKIETDKTRNFYVESFKKRFLDSTISSGKVMMKSVNQKFKIYNFNNLNDRASQPNSNTKVKRENSSGKSNSLSALSVSTPSSSASSFDQLIVYPSPTASSITLNAQSEVDLYTGRLSVSLPLTTLKSRSLEVPISLNYSTDGAKVDELGSWVGYGWGLSAGGAISRVMHDLPDEFSGIVSPLGTAFPAFGYLNTKTKVNLTALENSTDGNLKATTVINSAWQGLNGNFGVEAWDLQPDEFYFNFGKYSGKFVFNQDGNIVCVPYQNLTIKKFIENNTITGSIPKIVKFEVTTPEGVVYVFGDSNLSSVEESKIESLTLTNKYRYRLAGWTGNSPTPNPPIFYSRTVPILDQRFINNGEGISPINETWHNNSSLNTYFFFSSAWYLKEVISPNNDDKVTFNYANNGELSYFQNRSTSVNLPNLSEANVEGIGFFYKSWTAPVEKPVHPESEPFFFHEFPEKQTFQYTLTEIALKSKRLLSIESESGNAIDFIASSPRHDLIGDKMLDEIRVRSSQGVAKTIKIQYDTLWSPFTFDLFHIGIIGNTAFIMDADVQFTIKKLHLLQQRGFTFTEQQAYDFGAKYGNIMIGELFRFRIAKVVMGESEYKFNYSEGRLPRRFSTKQDQWGYFNNNLTGTLIKKIGYNGAFNPSVIVPLTGLPPLVGWTALKPNLTPLNSAGGANVNPDLSKCTVGTLRSISYPTGGMREFFYELNTSGSWIPASGLRVKEERIYSNPNASTEFESIKYLYTPSVSANVDFVRQTLLPRLLEEGMVTASSGIMNPVFKTKGGIVGYRTVIKFTEGLGKTVYTFTTPGQISNEPSRLYEFCFPCPPQEFSISRHLLPFPQDLDKDWNRGLLERVEVLDNTGKKLYVKVNSYLFNPGNLNIEFPVAHGFVGKLFSVDMTDFFRSGFFEYKSSTGLVDSTTEYSYDQFDPGNENKKSTFVTKFSYVPHNQTTVAHDLLPRKITQVFVNGERVINESRFTSDYTIASTGTDERAKGIFRLKEKGIDNVPIETIQYLERQEGAQLNRYYLSGTLTTFKEFTGMAGKVYPWQQFQLKAGSGASFSTHGWSAISGTAFSWPGASLYKPVLTFNGYDNFGNLVSSTGADGLMNSYTWGYGNALLTSAIQNPGPFQLQTSYSHAPLIGVTQITDPNNRSSKFTYDNFNRLKLTKDHDDQIVARYRYNYQNQNSNNQVDFTYTTEYTTETANVIKFTALGSLEPGTSLSWDFGNGSGKENGSSSEIKNYPLPGTFTVRLYAANPEYPTTSSTKQIRILPPAMVQITSPAAGTNVTVCGTAPVVCVATTTEGPYTFQWQYNYSESGSSNFVPVGANSNTLNFNVGGANGQSSIVRCKITDPSGNTRYSNSVVVFYNCNSGGGGGGGSCPQGQWWNPSTGQCETNPQCAEGCFWSGFECICP